jgi:hypothetical protein
MYKSAPTPHPNPTQPAAINAIQSKRLLECGCWRFNPSMVAFHTFNGVWAKDDMVSILLFCLQMNLIEKSQTRAATGKLLMQQ